MASWDISIGLPPSDVIAVLRRLPGVAVEDIPTGIGIDLGEGRAAWVDAAPSAGDPQDQASISVKDRSTIGAWRIYDHLAAQTTAPMQMWDDGGLLVSERRWQVSVRPGSPATQHIELVDWDSRAVGARLLGLARSGPLTPSDVLAVLADSGVPQDAVRDRSLELTGELVRAGLLRPHPTLHEQAPPRGAGVPRTQDLVFTTYALFRTGDDRTGTLVIGPAVPRDARATITAADVRNWMMRDFDASANPGSGAG
ncbi:hypothetical protein GCM10009868_13230 [Terrabacter aerolatus]|uniref:Uncharacterized protein n=1 Tax=Terrabacter aerolatus TaxID=422442 RepID=A0A512CY80_9MICO|nr:hypothetical protein [Terrabacter aerolatus]GEO29179.1 hypothetical protein TAE01_09890 [Terrabacter aerolatus]